jgi:DNA-binding HxlR family transcriptional regulator
MTQRGELPRPSEPGGPRKSYKHPCLIARTLDVLGDRWTLLVLRDLMAGLHRYSEILESCGGMSPNVLSDRLKRLEAEGLVCRTYQRGLPPRVEYALTEKGWAVRPILLSLIGWGRQYMEPVPQEELATDPFVDFAIRVIPTFAFDPAAAADLAASIEIEIDDLEDLRTWNFSIRDGHLYPRRERERAGDPPEVILRTTTAGFFKFLHGEAPAEDCGQLTGPPSVARAIQSCFRMT